MFLLVPIVSKAYMPPYTPDHRVAYRPTDRETDIAMATAALQAYGMGSKNE
jgi:hypothetical protein